MENEIILENTPSGVYKIHNYNKNVDGILVKFGGAIDIKSGNISKNNKIYGVVQFQQLEEQLNVGDNIPEKSKNIGPIVELIFDNPNSIDVLIKHLNHIKTELTN